MSASAPEDALAVGEIVRDTYTVEAHLGGGAFGAVYRVRHRFLGPQAMKVVRTGPSLPSIEEVLEEARLLATLIDPHVVRVFDANTVTTDSGERPYLTMELVVGGNLEEVLARKVRLNPLSALKTARQICAGLGVAHSRQPPVVHRDVKPQNVLVHSVSVHGTPQVKVGDFGLARHVDPDSRMSAAAGTLHYLPPEAAWGFHTPAGDVYATGVVLYQMLTGIFPFPLVEGHVDTLEQRRIALLSARRVPPAPPSRYCLGLPTQMDALVLRALAPDPLQRYPDALVLGQQLDHLIGEFTS